ncbi:hypothetical protein TWF730_008805 [Orbilia blumenaviensis]|uniref:BTB domain-containing protein n=1 Tax=Orbilia blumenaviensis TaxID=1796055 RepID=A0AAV9V532_9PEZI
MSVGSEANSTHGEPPTKRLRSEMPERPPRSTSEYGQMLGKFWDPEFSDIKVYVGVNLEEYKLHRTVICAESDFFRKACKYIKPSSSPRQIELPRIKTATFDNILPWMYGCGYRVPEDYDTSKLLDAYTAADYLGIDSLKEDIMQQIATTIHSDVVNNSTKDCIIQNPIHLMWRFSQVSSPKDFDMLQQPVKQFLALRGVNTEWVKGMASVKDNHNLFNGLIIDTLQKMLFSNFCQSCRLSLTFEPQKTCRGCDQRL